MAFVSHGVGDAYRGGIEDGGMGVGDGFDLTCGDVRALPFDHVARSIHEMDELVSVDAHVVASVEPAVSQHGAQLVCWCPRRTRAAPGFMRIGAANELTKVAPWRPD
jgi:hypothetical protein